GNVAPSSRRTGRGENRGRSWSELVADPQVDVAIDPGPGRGWMLELRALAEACFHRGLRQELPLVADLGRTVVGAVVRREQPAGVGPADGHADVMPGREVVDAGLHLPGEAAGVAAAADVGRRV